jgi:cellulose synthase/poly-beta-1,6-N-acetylglucosamine synthase-like glycosyltransferase
VLIHICTYLVLTLYGIGLTLIVLYSIGQLHLVVTFLKNRRGNPPEPPLAGVENLPFVTIQLPIYNELYVVERLLESMAAMDYPRDRFEIQLLDDSDDETVEVAAQKVAELNKRGIRIEHVRRLDRHGYKAGALRDGLELAKGEFIAIFDADFMPRPGYLRATLANFTDPRIGVVQARWEHINRNYSLFTEALAFHLDAHFTIEQFSRDRGGYYMNFNGTAGVWRKACIVDAGGWEADTLTEDLDLSYRAQIKGWTFRYIDRIGTPSELPAEIGAIKSQQYRWMKGGAEVARKMLRNVWRSDAPLIRKLHGTMHLMSSAVFVVVLVLGATSIPLLYLKHGRFGGNSDFMIVPAACLGGSFLILASLYLITCSWRERTVWQGMRHFLLYYLPFLTLTMGLSLHNSIAVIQGFWGKKTAFVRTPKFNITSRSDKWQGKKYLNRKIKPSVYFELLLTLYFCFGVLLSFHFRDFSALPFMLMQMVGFGLVGINSLHHAWVR